ncbi:MAG: DNA-processing protein DprA [Patescibacteria group bacterium]
MEETIFLHALRIIPHIGNQALKSALDFFGSAENIWQATPEELLRCTALSEKIRAILLTERTSALLDQAEKELERYDINLFSCIDPLYPALLKEIPDAPAVLYSRGSYDWSRPKPMIALVGSRKYTPYGEQAAQKLSEELSRAGVIVVSGLAFGIDSVAHIGALDGGNDTLAVLGGGIDDKTIAPQTHLNLAKRILSQGALVSEYPMETPPTKWSFPQRNRIIAGMTLGTVVIEAAEQSGSLITARLALDYNREVFAVPGSIFSPVSTGTNQLIKNGAKIVRSVSDILEELTPYFEATFQVKSQEKHLPQNLSPEEITLLKILSHEPLHVDKIIKATTLETAVANSTLVMLEIKGIIRNTGGMNYIRIDS